MASLAGVLKEEVVRVAGVEIRRHARPVAKALASSEREIVSLRRDLEKLRGELSVLKEGGSPKREVSGSRRGTVNGKTASKRGTVDGKSKTSSKRGAVNGKTSGGNRGVAASRNGSSGRASSFVFSADRLKEHRQRLGISADSYGALMGVSGLSVYNWENGRAVPRKSSLDALGSIAGLGKREALRRLDALNGQGGGSSGDSGDAAPEAVAPTAADGVPSVADESARVESATEDLQVVAGDDAESATNGAQAVAGGDAESAANGAQTVAGGDAESATDDAQAVAGGDAESAVPVESGTETDAVLV